MYLFAEAPPTRPADCKSWANPQRGAHSFPPPQPERAKTTFPRIASPPTPLPEFADGMATSVEHDSREGMDAPQTAVEVEETKTFKDLVRVDDASFLCSSGARRGQESGCLPSGLWCAEAAGA